jgi:hypothetical protein
LEVDDNSVMIVDNTQAVLGKQLKPHPIPLIKIIITFGYFLYIISF